LGIEIEFRTEIESNLELASWNRIELEHLNRYPALVGSLQGYKDAPGLNTNYGLLSDMLTIAIGNHFNYGSLFILHFFSHNYEFFRIVKYKLAYASHKVQLWGEKDGQKNLQMRPYHTILTL